tara:strand:- start:1600 stop:2436 length:837 start_codon:yes stop_codon:yes gene_type:complete
MNKFVFIADYFIEEVPGGGEMNNDQACSLLLSLGYDIEKVHSKDVTLDMLEPDNNYIIANFVNLPEQCKRKLEKEKRYVIYEHDHKYVANRNPAQYPGFIAPKDQIVNYNFYKKAQAVLCQSKFHQTIVKNNLSLDNIVSLGGNLWTQESLDLMSEISSQKKKNKFSIMASQNWHKNTQGAVTYCKVKNLDYDLILQCPYEQFLQKLGTNEKFLFLPQTPETLSRIVVEARMMGMRVFTNNNVGATKEDWFKLKGSDLISVMQNKRKEIPNKIIEIFK